MITEKDIWWSYQRAKGKNINYPTDKKWESVYKKLNETNKEIISTLAVYFNTKWQNVDIDRYMETGFYLWKSFSYKHFLDTRLIDKYKQLDKSRKRKKVTNTDLKESIKFIIYNRYNLDYYGNIKEDGFSLPVNDYLKGKIDALVIVYMIEKGYLQLNQEASFIPYIIDRYEELKDKVNKKKILLEAMEDAVMTKQGDKEKYLQDPEKKKKNNQDEDVEEKLLYGDEETMEEKKRKEQQYKEKPLNE